MTQATERFRDRRGIALPVALVGLVAASLLVTTALLTSTTESAISAAQSDGTRALYDAEGGLQEYLRQVAVAGTGLDAAGTAQVILPENGRTVRITRAILREDTSATTNVRRIVSLFAEPMQNGQARGRAVLAFVRQQGDFSSMALNVKEGAVVGTDLEVGGNSRVIDRSTICADTTSDPGAVKHAAGAEVSSSGSGDISGEVRESANSGEAFEREILNGYTLETFADLAEIKFGARWGQSAFPTNGSPRHDHGTEKLRWGCPVNMGVNCSGADTTYYPIIAIDAGGGAVDLQGEHGQGILIILNGHLKVTGNFRFKGLLLVDGYIDMAGTGGNDGAKVEGSVIAFGNNTDQKSRVTETETHGNAVIAYNRCAIDAAQESFNRRSRQFPTYNPPTVSYAWFEVVR